MKTNTETLGHPSSFTGKESSRVFFAVTPFALAIALIWPFGGTRKIEMNAAQSVPAARGVVYLGHDPNNNTKVDLKVTYLAHPNSLTPPAADYVVWIQANGRSPEDQGELHIDGNLKGELKIVTPYKDFTIFVTAEQDPRPQSPGEQVLTAQVAK